MYCQTSYQEIFQAEKYLHRTRFCSRMLNELGRGTVFRGSYNELREKREWSDKYKCRLVVLR